MKRLPAILAPIALSAYPVLFLFAHNQGQTYAADLGRPLAVSMAGGALVLGCAALVYRDVAKAGLLASAFVVLFFGYGHVVNLFPAPSVTVAVAVGAVEAVLLVVLAVALTRLRSSPEKPVALVALVAGVLVAFAVSSMAIGAWNRRQAARAGTSEAGGVQVRTEGRRPDIYYIILDSYPSERSLREFYGYDNAPFLEALQSRGFTVTPDSKSNYGATLLSLGSSLNMTHLEELTAPYRETSDRTVLMDAVRNSEVVRLLRERGYRFVNVASGFSGTDPMPTADEQLRFAKGSLSEFEVLAISTTPLAELPAIRETSDPFLLRRYAVLHAFEALATIEPSGQPMFVLAHVLSPHPPFVFDADGGMRERKGRFNHTKYSHDEYVEGFRGQVTFVNARLVPAIDAILSRYGAANQPIVIIQGDHGPRSLRRRNNTSEAFYRERFSILNAYHIPKDFTVALYPSISPVNSFRAVCSGVFGAKLEMLPDESYFSTSGRPYAFKPVSALARSDAPPPADDDGEAGGGDE